MAGSYRRGKNVTKAPVAGVPYRFESLQGQIALPENIRYVLFLEL